MLFAMLLSARAAENFFLGRIQHREPDPNFVVTVHSCHQAALFTGFIRRLFGPM
jgi:hypothetical protein